MELMAERVGDRKVLRLVSSFLRAGVVEQHGGFAASLTGTPQGGLCAAAHNPPYEQRWVMRSVDPSSLVTTGSGAERCT
jgi:RNA-directed DNA polymerase